jgi:hypothetical protein
MPLQYSSFSVVTFLRNPFLAASVLLLGACVDQPVGSGALQAPRDGASQSKGVETVSVTDFGAVANDGGNDSYAFQQAVNTGRNVHVPAGDWHIHSTVNVPTDTRVYGTGAGSRLIAASPNMYAILDAVGPNDGAVYDVVVESLGFQGNNEGWHHAFRARWGQRIRFSDNVVRGTGVINVDNSNGVEVLRNNGSATIVGGLHGVDLNYARNVTVQGNTITHYEAGIQWWGGEGDPRKPATFSRAKLTGNHTISGNTVHYTSAGIWGGNGEHITVTGNDVQVCADVCLDAEGSDDVRFISNTAKYAGTAVLASFFLSSNILFQDNTVGQDGVPHGTHPHAAHLAQPWRSMFALYSTYEDPADITTEVRGNRFTYTPNGSGVGVLHKESSLSMIIADNMMVNTVIDMAYNNNGAVQVSNNQMYFHYDTGRPAIYVGSNHMPNGVAATSTAASGNTVHSYAAQSRAGIEVWQWAWGAALTSTIENNIIRGFPTAIRYRNENQAHNWRIVGNTTDGIWENASTWAPNIEVRNNGIGIHSWYKYEDRLWGHDPNEGYAGGYQLSRPNWFYVVGRAPSSAYVQIFRCKMSQYPYRHILTTSASCNGDYAAVREDLGGMYGIRSGYQGSFPGVVPLYRLRYPGNGDIYFTADESEKNDIVAGGWQQEGIIAYVWR